MKNETQVWLRSASALVAAGALMLGMAGCNGCGSNTPAPITSAANGPDPADANMASADGSQPTQVMGRSEAYTPRQSGESYSSTQQAPAPGQQAPAPIVSGSAYNGSQNYNTQPNGYYDNGQQAYTQGYDNGAADAYAETDQAPPELPVYEQPPAPDDNDIWTPGYWGYANTGYYWVPGAWVTAPYIGALWTPGYWGWYGGHYRWHRGYWGRHIGYYGGIDYGHGYIGSGYYGGYWNGDRFYYNSAVSRVSPRIHNVYERNVVVNNVRYPALTSNRVSYNGGRGGVNYQPRAYETAAMHEQHIGALPAQQQFHREAAVNRANFYADNHGRPDRAALAQPVRTEHIVAPAEVSRGGFGRGPAPVQNALPNSGANQRNDVAAQRLQMEQQRNAQLQQRNQAEQQRNLVEQQRIQNQQQRNAAEQQRNQQVQQRNEGEQQRNLMEQQRNQQLHQRNNALDQQRAQQIQRDQNEQQRNLVEQQRIQNQQQRSAAEQQRNQQLQQRNQAEQQRNLLEQQRNQQVQQRNAMEQQRNGQLQQQRSAAMEQQRIREAQRNAELQQPRPAPQQPRFQTQPLPHTEQPRPQAPQPRFEQRPAPQPRVEAPRAAPAPHAETHAPPAGGGGHPGDGEGHPGGGGHH